MDTETLRMTRFSIMTFSIMTFSIMTFSIMTFSITTFSIMTLSIKGLFATLSITTIFHDAECYYAQWGVLFIITLNVVILSVITMSVVAPNFNLKPTVPTDNSFREEGTTHLFDV